MRPVTQEEKCTGCNRCRQVYPILEERSLIEGATVTLVLIHTEKGRKLWGEVAVHMRYVEAPGDALTDNPSATASSALTGQREQFFARFRQEDFRTLIDELCPKPAAPAKLSFLRRCIRKL